MPNFYLEEYDTPQPIVLGNNNPSNNPLWEMNPLQEESPLASKNNSSTVDAGKVIPSAGSKMFHSPSYSDSVAELYGQKLTTGEKVARALEPLLATLPAALISGAIGGRRGAGRSIQGSMKAIEPLQEERYKTEEARRQMFEKDPRLQRSYLDSIRQGFKLTEDGGQPVFGDLMAGNVQDRYAAEDLERIQNPFDLAVQEGAGRPLPFKFDDISEKIAQMQGRQAQYESAARFPYQEALAKMPQQVVTSSSTYEPPKEPNLPMFDTLKNQAIDQFSPQLPTWVQSWADKLKTPLPQGKTKTSDTSTIRKKGGDPVEPNRPSIKGQQTKSPSEITNPQIIESLDYYRSQGKMPGQRQIDTWLQNGVSENILRQYGFLR